MPAAVPVNVVLLKYSPGNPLTRLVPQVGADGRWPIW
jgi:hypothetical protein